MKLPARLLWRGGAHLPRSVPEEADSKPGERTQDRPAEFFAGFHHGERRRGGSGCGKTAVEAGLDEDERFRISMAVREAAVNAVLHGNEYNPAKRVDVSLENTGAALVFTIADQGRGLDPETLPDPWRRKPVAR